jgi:hypothetical protein
MRPRIDPRARGVLLLLLISAVAGWLERRPPAWLEADPLLEPFGLEAPPDPVAAMDSLLHPPPPPAPEARVIDPNAASREEWIALPGVGPATADRIGAWLQSGRRFRRAEDLKQVKGIGPRRVEQLRPWLQFHEVPDDSLSSRAADASGPRGN